MTDPIDRAAETPRSLELQIAINLGCDVECSGCMTLAFTGYSGPHAKHTCEKAKTMTDEELNAKARHAWELSPHARKTTTPISATLRAVWEDGYRARAAEPPQPASVGGVCLGCGAPFVSPDFDPRCSSCVESGTGPEAIRPAEPPHPSNEELVATMRSGLMSWYVPPSPKALEAFAELERRLTGKA